MSKGNLLERLEKGVIVGDGSLVMTLEKRGYVSVGSWTPEAAYLYPNAVRQLHREFLRAGSDVMQTFTFFSSDDKLAFDECIGGDNNNARHKLTSAEINNSACDLAIEVANEGDALVAGCLSPVPCYGEGKGKEIVQDQFRRQCKVYMEKDVDFLLGEFYAYVEEAEWAILAMKECSSKPVACTMRICPVGDMSGVSPQECAIRMAKAGADVIGINCMYDPDICLETLGLMKAGLESAGLKAYLMAQPVGFHTQDIANNPEGYTALPEFPFAMEKRLLSRVDAQTFARKAYDLGVRYIGGCCGFEPYHIRAIAEELSEERGKKIPGADMSPGVEGLKKSMAVTPRHRANHDYWKNLVPSSGRRKNNFIPDS